MRTIVAGSRNLDKYRCFYETYLLLSSMRSPVTEFVTGNCPTGADQVPYLFNQTSPTVFKITAFPADWNRYGKRAGPIRNREMAKYADRLILIWDGKSLGSKNMKDEMIKLNKPVYEVVLD